MTRREPVELEQGVALRSVPVHRAVIVDGALGTEPRQVYELVRGYRQVEDLAKIQDYMSDKMEIIKEKIDVEKLVDTQFAKAAGAN